MHALEFSDSTGLGAEASGPGQAIPHFFMLFLDLFIPGWSPLC